MILSISADSDLNRRHFAILLPKRVAICWDPTPDEEFLPLSVTAKRRGSKSFLSDLFASLQSAVSPGFTVFWNGFG